MACAHDPGSTPEACALVTIKSIGTLSRSVNQTLTREVRKVIQQNLGMADDRIHCVVEEQPATHWGWKGSTFG